METKAKQTPETEHEFVENVPDLSSIAISPSNREYSLLGILHRNIPELIYICMLCSV